MEREKLTFTSERARQIIYDDDNDFRVVQNYQQGSSRWAIHFKVVVKREIDGKFFASTYSKGATEQQEHRPYEDEPAIFTEVFPVEKTITVYE